MAMPSPDLQPCTLHIQIRQTIRMRTVPSERRYSLAELALLWLCQPHTISNWLWRLRKSPLAPQPGHITTRRLPGKSGRVSPFRRTIDIRADYVRMIAEVFIEKNNRL